MLLSKQTIIQRHNKLSELLFSSVCHFKIRSPSTYSKTGISLPVRGTGGSAFISRGAPGCGFQYVSVSICVWQSAFGPVNTASIKAAGKTARLWIQMVLAAAAADISAHRVRLDESRWLEKDLLYAGWKCGASHLKHSNIPVLLPYLKYYFPI